MRSISSAKRSKAYNVSKIVGDAFAGQTFRKDFAERDIGYEVRTTSASQLYEAFEPVLMSGEVELLDEPTLIEQLVSLIWKGQQDHAREWRARRLCQCCGAGGERGASARRCRAVRCDTGFVERRDLRRAARFGHPGALPCTTQTFRWWCSVVVVGCSGEPLGQMVELRMKANVYS